MAKIITFGSSQNLLNENKFNKSLVSTLWEGFKSLDKFTRLQIIAVILIAIATPVITTSYLALNVHAYLTPSLLTPANASPSYRIPPGQLNKLFPSTNTSQNYTVDSEVVNLLNAINKWRSQNGNNPLTPSVALTNVANWMANDMATNNYISHYDSLGRWICPLTSGSTLIPGRTNVITNTAYCTYFYSGEELAAGYTTGSSVFIQIQGSSLNNSTILNKKYTTVGVYRVNNPNSNYGSYWAIVLGSYIDGPVANYVVPLTTSTPTPTSTPAPLPTSTPAPTSAPLSSPTPTPIANSCPTALQTAIDSAASGSILNLPGCTYSGSITISHPITLTGFTLNVPASTVGITISSNNVTLNGVHVLGPGLPISYDSNSMGVQTQGSSNSFISGLIIENSEIGDFGGWGMYLHFVSSPTIQNNNVHDNSYSGIMVLSGTGGNISGNKINDTGYNISNLPGSNNAYGIALTDLNGEPRTSGTTVSNNTITNTPTWHAMDTHGGQNITFSNNTVYSSSRALFITADGNGNQPTSVMVTGNLFGNPSPITFNLVAVTTYDSINVTINGNKFSTGWNGNYVEDYNHLSTGLVIENSTYVTP